MTDLLQYIDLGDVATLILLIVGWVRLHTRILRLEVLTYNDFRHRLEAIEKHIKSEDIER